MANDFPYLYPYSRADARDRKETRMHEESFRLNVCCARAIEQAIRGYANEADECLEDGCALSVLEQYGFKRVNLVLANSLKELQSSICRHLISDETCRWGRETYLPPDGGYNRRYVVDTAAAPLEAFIRQTRDAYQALGLFGLEHCAGDKNELDYTGRVLVLSPGTLREACWDPRNQLWYAHDGFGCSPHAIGRSIRATCLGDGEMTRWNRTDFTGALDERYLPDWALDRLAQLRGPEMEQGGGPAMDGMTIS